MQLHQRTINTLAEMICGAHGTGQGFSHEGFIYRSSSRLTQFFSNCDMDYIHDGSTRKDWVVEVLTELNDGSASNSLLPADSLVRVVRELLDIEYFQSDKTDRSAALAHLNSVLQRDRLEAYFDETGVCQLRITSSHITTELLNPMGRSWSLEERRKRGELSNYLDSASEDDFIENVLQPVFDKIGFKRISVTGHKDKALEYGKDIWMKYQLPTSHFIYFGIQVKRTKIDSAGKSKNENVAEIFNQINMMLGHPIWDPETNQHHLVDHVYIISAAEITKQAKNWIGQNLDQSKRRHILFMDREDLLDLALRVNLQLLT